MGCLIGHGGQTLQHVTGQILGDPLNGFGVHAVERRGGRAYKNPEKSGMARLKMLLFTLVGGSPAGAAHSRRAGGATRNRIPEVLFKPFEQRRDRVEHLLPEAEAFRGDGDVFVFHFRSRQIG